MLKWTYENSLSAARFCSLLSGFGRPQKAVARKSRNANASHRDAVSASANEIRGGGDPPPNALEEHKGGVAPPTSLTNSVRQGVTPPRMLSESTKEGVDRPTLSWSQQ